MRRAPLALLCAAALLLAACTGSADASDPTWVPSPDFGTNGEGPGVDLTPIIPKPSQSSGPAGQNPPQPQGGAPSSSSTASPVVATKLRAPVGLTLLPDGTALVGERTTGRIVRVQPQPGQPVPTVRTIRGLDVSGDGGLLDLALSPTYAEDNLIYAYITTRTDNRVVDFTLTGPVAPVLTGIPKGTTGNTGRILFGADNNLYVGTGDTGRPSLATNPKSLAGKVLRVNAIGAKVAGNPSGTAVWTSGQHVVDGLCAAPQSTTVFDVESGPDEINSLRGGESYGSAGTAAVGSLPTGYTGPGGCAVRNGVLWITSLDGKALLATRVLGSGTQVTLGKFAEPSLRNTFGRLRTVVAAPDGALWLTTSNRDGKGKPVADDERVLRVFPPTGGGGGSKPV